jgi:hypothetical protein
MHPEVTFANACQASTGSLVRQVSAIEPEFLAGAAHVSGIEVLTRAAQRHLRLPTGLSRARDLPHAYAHGDRTGSRMRPTIFERSRFALRASLYLSDNSI